MNDAFGINNLSTCIELSMKNEKNINGYMSKKKILSGSKLIFKIYIYLRNIFHVAVHLFRTSSQMLKCGASKTKREKDKRSARAFSHGPSVSLSSYRILTQKPAVRYHLFRVISRCLFLFVFLKIHSLFLRRESVQN